MTALPSDSRSSAVVCGLAAGLRGTGREFRAQGERLTADTSSLAPTAVSALPISCGTCSHLLYRSTSAEIMIRDFGFALLICREYSNRRQA